MQLHLQLWQDFIDLCQSLTQEQYTHKLTWLNGVSIAEHLRHSYEFYLCLLQGSNGGEVNYENRKRDRKIETDLGYTLERLEALKIDLSTLTASNEICLRSKEAVDEKVISSLERELLYCLDHAIHHQALIKIGLRELNLSFIVSPDFGVAYSTLRYRAGA